MAVYEVNGTFMISSDDAWLPGNYDTQRTARWAFRFPDAVLTDLEERANGGEQRPITSADLRTAKTAS
jgi:hypothetical protein